MAPRVQEVTSLIAQSREPLVRLKQGVTSGWAEWKPHIEKLEHALKNATDAGVPRHTLSKARAVRRQSSNLQILNALSNRPNLDLSHLRQTLVELEGLLAIVDASNATPITLGALQKAIDAWIAEQNMAALSITSC